TKQLINTSHVPAARLQLLSVVQQSSLQQLHFPASGCLSVARTREERQTTDYCNMRFGFDLEETDDREKQERKSPTPISPKGEEIQWLPLQNHPVFTLTPAVAQTSGEGGSAGNRMPGNLMAWDGASRLYFWELYGQCLHRIPIRLGEPDEHSVIAASPSKVLRANIELNFRVHKISINRNGSAVMLVGASELCVMYLSGRTSANDGSILCSTVQVGFDIYFSAIRVLQVAWHPYSDTHVGVLSSDSVFRIFDLSSAPGWPEQEYYLQLVETGRSQKAASICPVDFSFGREHLWDKFSVLILFTDGSVYVLCPVAPFGSVYMWESIMEMHVDAQAFGLKSANPAAVRNSTMAISWLDATFPELNQQGKEVGSYSMVKARSHALIDASILLQGPLRKVCHSREEEDNGAQDTECKCRATSLLYNSIGKDSILVIAWGSGKLQIDALGDEIQPLWRTGSPPHLCVDSHDQILGFAMICESTLDQLPVIRLDQPLDNGDWLGHPPPLLRLAIVDLALPTSRESDSLVSMYIDPLLPERIYALHGGGVDLIILHFLPFASQTSGSSDAMREPSVHPVLSTFQGTTASSFMLCGFVILADSYGYSWIAGVTTSNECIVLEMKTWNFMLPLFVGVEKSPSSLEESTEREMPNIISKELLSGPKVVIIPQASPNLRSVAADSIEGRSTLHQYFKLFHENYVEYAHKVYFELKHHGPHVKRIIDSLHIRLQDAQQKLSNVEEKQQKLNERIKCAFQLHSTLEERLKRLRKLPGVHKKPLSRAERKFKAELDRFSVVELDAMRSSIAALNARLTRHIQSPTRDSSYQKGTPSAKKSCVQDVQLDQLKASLQKLSLVNSENTRKVKLVESALKGLESDS
ncbi:hypothetical protein Ancab_034470, partial [Ancistrocladus abbreviatus]